MRVIGIDSAELTGFAVVDVGGGKELLLRHGTFDARTAADVEAAADQLLQVAVDLVAIEEPFVHPRNPSTGLVLARLLGRWLQAFETRGLTTVTVPASCWQVAVLPGVTRATRSGDRKTAAIALARGLYGVTVGEDEADAIAMATWVARNATRRYAA